MGRGGQRPPSPATLAAISPPLRDEELQHYTVLEGAAYDLRKLGERHPGGALALSFAGGRDLSRTWAGLHGFADPQKTRAWLTHMRVRDKELERRIVRRAKPDAYSEGDNVSAHLARIEREASSFNELAQKGRVPPRDPPSHLIERDLGGELGTRVRWLFRRKAHSQKTSLHAATKAPTAYWPWLVFVVTAFLTSYVMWVRGSYLGLIALGPLGQLLAFAVMHDASHYAISTKRWVNVALAYAGVAYTSPHEWTLQHVLGHHVRARRPFCSMAWDRTHARSKLSHRRRRERHRRLRTQVAPNVEGEDPDVVHARRYMKALTGVGKAFDALLVWLVALPAAITLLAPVRVRKNDGVYPASTVHEGERSMIRHVAHFAGRVIHALAFFVWPFYVYSPLTALMWVLIPACSGSLVFMAVTQVAHLLEATIEGPSNAPRSWASQQIANACDFAPDSPLVARLTGGLNRQVEHHLFPTVHHSHLPELSSIVEAVTKRRGLDHHVLPSATKALGDHLAFLRSLEAAPPLPVVYDGTVVHARAPIANEPRHRFSASHAMWLLPLDDPEAMRTLERGCIKWRAADHLRSRPGERKTPKDVADAVRSLCRERGGSLKRVDSPDSVIKHFQGSRRTGLGSVSLLTMPRTFGYVFNPISVYYVRDANGKPAYVVFEVSNTPWLEETLYVHPVNTKDTYEDMKKMHVSPFQPMGQTYTWTAPFPSTEVSLRVDVSRGDKPYFVATFDGNASTAPSTSLGRVRTALKLTPHTAVLLIHAHAALLLAKGAKFYPHPSGVKTAMSRCIEVIYHSRYRLLAYYLLRRLHAPQYLIATAALSALQRAASVLSRKSSSKNVSSKDTKDVPFEMVESPKSNSTPMLATDEHLSGAAAGKRVAIIGSGIAGNGAAYLLKKRGVDVTIFESDAKPGGHALTVEVEGRSVDVGFQVFNLANYPRLSKLFDELGVQHVQSDMSLSCEGKDCWSSKNPLVGCLFSPAKLWQRLSLLMEILKFEKRCKQLLQSETDPSLSIQEWLNENNFSERLAREYCEPMVGAIWSRTQGDVLDEFPILGVAQFLANHYMLDRARPAWRTPRLRSQDYVHKLVEKVGRDAYRLSSRVRALHKDRSNRWVVESDSPTALAFDAVILACDAPTASSILGDQAPDLLKALKVTKNDVTVHRDKSLMPSDRNAWAAWNCRPNGVLTYWANVLQPGVDDQDLFITLNGSTPAPLWRRTLAHPVLDAASQKWRESLPSLQGNEGIYFAGAWCGFGFHEDGLKSAYDAVDALCGTTTPIARSPFVASSSLTKTALRCVCRGARALAARTADVTRPRPEIVLTLPEGLDFIAADAVSSKERVEVRILDGRAAWRLLADPSMGLAEGYMEGSLDLKPSIRSVLHAALKCKNKDAGDSPQNVASRSLLTVGKRFTDVMQHACNANTKSGSLKNIAAHYDLSNAFYELWLDETLTYSSALFDDHEPYLRREGLLLDDGRRGTIEEDSSDDVLKAGQLRKLDSLLDKAGVQDGDRILEIGCGWGSLALRCTERFPNCEYVAITISREQLNEASQRLEGKSNARVVFCDYRDAREKLGLFDRVLSCEMIEAVGHAFLPSYFSAIHACLKGGGSAALQVITVPDERYASYIKGSDFIRKHVFPGSSLVCLEAVKKALPKLGSLALRLDDAATLSMGVSYARTLRAWRVRFDAVEDQVSKLGFDDVFIRKWRYYLDYCEAGFACGHIDVKQIRLEKTDESLAVEATEGAHGSKPISVKDMTIKAVKGVATTAFERGLLPDFVTRYGIRQLSAQQLRHCDDAGRAANNGEAGLAGSQEKLRETIQALLEAPVAVCTSEANEQHYEVDARFYGLCLGPHRKYSACLYEGAEPKWPGNKLQKDAARLLPKAEKDSLDQVAARGDITQSTKAILDCGCGWGSASLYLADRFRNAQVVGVSNSHSQRRYIMGQAQERGLTNLQIVTLDLSKEPLTKALEALQSRLPGQYFERGVSIEMFEHMKNYKALFEKITAVLEDQGRFFVHVFCHRQYAYHFVAKSDADWMAKYFFAGGTMPSADLFVHFAARKDAPVALVDHWRNSGVHYALTAEGWLQNMDANAAEVREILKEAYPEGETELWFHRWRAFYLACVELFGYDGGQEWCIGHYLFEKR